MDCPTESGLVVRASMTGVERIRWLSRSRGSQRLVILMYHGVEAQAVSLPCWHVIDVATFRRQVEYLGRHFNVLPLEEALERLQTGTLPERAAALTFDDGTRNLATVAAPVLRSKGVPATVFLTTGSMYSGDPLWTDRLWLAFARTTVPDVDLTAIGLQVHSLRSIADRGAVYAVAAARLKDLPDAERITQVDSLTAMLGRGGEADAGPFQMLSWDEARALSRDADVTLQPHSVTHPILSHCSDAKVKYEVDESCAAVERETGCTPTVFAYPNGRAQDFDERAKAAVRARGIGWALAGDLGIADRNSDPLALPRVAIGNNLSFARFWLKLSMARWRNAALPLRDSTPGRKRETAFTSVAPGPGQPSNGGAHEAHGT